MHLTPLTPLSHATQAVQEWLEGFDAALQARDVGRAAVMFEEGAYWRDLLAFTWNLKTIEGVRGIEALLQDNIDRVAPRNWRLEQGQARQTEDGVEAWLDVDTADGRAKAHVRLRNGRCWTLFTALRELRGHEERKGRNRWRGTDHHYGAGRQSWLDMQEAERARMGTTAQPYVLIVGGGQGGLALAARLRRLSVPALVIDSLPRPGDAWRRRYKSLCLHDPVWYDHLPYLPFPDDWPVFTPRDKLADWLEAYAKVMEIHFWGETTARSARFDEASGTWEVHATRGGSEVVLRPTQLVFALGVSGYPIVPTFPGQETFGGTQHHSSAHPGGAAWRGKRCVVVGANNSAHDICADLWEHGAEVAMVQRSSTLVVRSDTYFQHVTGKLYSEDALDAGIDTDRADLIQASVPLRLAATLAVPVWEEIARADAPFYDRLRAVGFQLDFGEDGSGLAGKYLRRGSGYYIDVGASELVANGQIALRSGVGIARIEPDAVVLDSGERLPADLIVYATGYGSMNEWVAEICSPEVADRVGMCWGLGSDTQRDPGPWEGELRNMWKPTHQPHLWFHGGNLCQSRHFSLYLALQLKARYEGIVTPVWGMEPVHHRR